MVIHWSHCCGSVGILVLAACTHKPQPSDPPILLLRDSATVQIGPSHTVVGPADLNEVRGVRIAPNGEIAFADAGSHQIYILAPDGSEAARFGRAGGGPGEFREPVLVAFWGDSLAVFDPPQRRLSFLRRDGSLIRDRAMAVPGVIAPSVLGIRADGGVIFKGTVLLATPSSGSRIRASAIVLAIDARERVDTVAIIDDGVWRTDGPLFYAARSAVAVTDSGIWFGAGNRPELHFQPWSGSEHPVRRWDATARAVDAADREKVAAIAAERRAAPGLTAPERFADSMPLFASLLPDPSGGIWVIGPAAPFSAPDSIWVVTENPGAIRAVTLPRAMRPLVIGPDFVLGLRTGEDGGTELVRTELRR